MKRPSGSKVVVAFGATALAGLFAAVPFARAGGSAGLPAAGNAPDEITQVLEIPQQCNVDAVAALCDRSGAALNYRASGSATGGVSEGSGPNLPAFPDEAALSSDPTEVAYGSIDDYESQFLPSDPAPAAPYAPMPVFVPVFVAPAYSFGAPLLAPVVRRPRLAPDHGGYKRGRP